MKRLFLAALLLAPVAARAQSYLGLLAYTGSTSATVTTSSAQIIAAGAYTHSLTIQNAGTSGNVWINPACGTAAANSGGRIPPGASWVFGSASNPIPTGCITAISDGASITVSIVGG